MSRSLRYKNPVICEHLASQYVVAVMSPKVRTRMEQLRLQYPEINSAVANWSDKFVPLHESYLAVTPSAHVWPQIEKAITVNSHEKLLDKTSWWDSLRFWKITGLSTTATTCALLVGLFIGANKSADNTIPLVSSTPNYIAVMSPFSAKEASTQDIRFVVNVYQKTETAPTQIFLQWSENHTRSNNAGMYLWAEDKTTGELSYVGHEPNQAPWTLDKANWLIVSNSSRLIFTSDTNRPTQSNTLFSGPCIQLGSWKHDTISL